MKENQAPTTSWESRKLPELIKENPALVANIMVLVNQYNLLEKGVVTMEELDGFGRMMMERVKRHQLLEKGVITQKELDYFLSRPEGESTARSRLTHYKILKMDNPKVQLEDLE